MPPLELTQVLAFKPTLRAEPLNASTVLLIGEHERFVLSGRRAAEVAALIDGRRTVLDIMNAAVGRISEPETLYTLHQLVERGYLVPATPDSPPTPPRSGRASASPLTPPPTPCAAPPSRSAPSATPPPPRG